LRTLKIGPGYHDMTTAGFSHSSSELTVGLYCASIQVWGVRSSSCLQVLETGYTSAVVLSHGSTRLAWTTNERTIIVWDLEHNQRTVQDTQCRRDDPQSVLQCHGLLSLHRMWRDTPGLDRVGESEQLQYIAMRYDIHDECSRYGGKQVLWVPWG
jgi:hypothetical protein